MADAPDFNRIKANVRSMIDQGAPEADIDAYVQGEGTTAEAISAVPQQTGMQKAGAVASDVAKSAGSGLVRGVTGVMGAPADINSLGQGLMSKYVVGPMANYLSGPKPDTAPKDMFWGGGDIASAIGSHSINQGIDTATGAPITSYQPETKVGEYTKTTGEFAAGALAGPGSVTGNLMRFGVAPALASETAGQATKGTKWEPWARAITAIITGGGAALTGRAPYAERMAGRAAGNTTEGQYAHAEALAQDAAARGIQLTPAEAIQQVTGGGTRLGDVQRIAESTAEGGQRIAPMMAERPGQVAQATEAGLNQIAPRSPTPGMVGVEGQQAAQDAINQTRQQINKLSSSFYKGAENTPIPASDYAMLQNLPGYSQALETVRSTPQLARYVHHLPDDSVGVLNEVKKQLDVAAENAAGAFNPQRNQQVAGGYTQDAGTVNTTGRSLSPDYGQALDVQAQGRQRVLAPLEAGPTGTIANTSDVRAQAKALLGPDASPQEVARTVRIMAAQNPQATSSVIREGLGQTADKTVRGLDNMARPDQFGGAKFAREVRGNGRQSDNINAAIETASGAPIRDDVNRLVDALQATGQRQRPGSLTAFNQEAIGDMQRGGTGAIAQAVAKPLTAVKDTVARARLGRSSNQLADLLLSGPEGVRRIQELAARGDDRAAIIAQLLLSGRAGSDRAQ